MDKLNFSGDKWSNSHNKQTWFDVVTTKKGENSLVETTDASGNSYTVEYLKNVEKNSIINCAKEFMSIVRNLVTDNTFSVKGHITSKCFRF